MTATSIAGYAALDVVCAVGDVDGDAIDPHAATGNVNVPFPSVYYAAYPMLSGYDASRPYGDMLVDPIGKLGLFPGTSFERRLSASFAATQPE